MWKEYVGCVEILMYIHEDECIFMCVIFMEFNVVMIEWHVIRFQNQLGIVSSYKIIMGTWDAMVCDVTYW